MVIQELNPIKGNYFDATFINVTFYVSLTEAIPHS